MLRFEVSLQAQAPVAAVPQPQFVRGRGRRWLVAGLRTIWIKVREDMQADPVQ